jgi:ABC-2 type transport system ATP-binding protein
MTTPIVKIESLNKSYRKQDPPALKNTNLEVFEGERIGLIGHNGSGKTTLMRCLLNFLIPEKGNILICGEHNLEIAKQHIGFIPERQHGLENFTPNELLTFAVEMRGIANDPALPLHLKELKKITKIDAFENVLIGELSKGMFQRVQLCLALLHKPLLLLLDEPTSGLDPSGKNELLRTLQDLSDITMIYASHQLEEIEQLCTKVVILHQGEVRHIIPEKELNKSHFRITLPISGKNLLVENFANECKIYNENADTITVDIIAEDRDFQKFSSFLQEHNVPILRLRTKSYLEMLYEQYSKQ